MPEHSTELSSLARYAALPRLMHGLSGLAVQLGVPESELSRIQVVFEELFSNSIDHGYGGECDKMIGIDLRKHDAALTLIYRDQAPPFDLTLCSASNPVDGQIGGLGINLILGMSSAIRYQRQNDCNQLEIDF